MLHIAILGAGNIAGTMARTLNGMEEKNERFCCYAVAARELERAEAFAKKYGFEKAYGSYEEMVADENVDFVYIATPHGYHYEHIKLCLEHGKHVLCEKAFTLNAAGTGGICNRRGKRSASYGGNLAAVPADAENPE